MGQSPPGESYNRDGIGDPLLNGPTEFGPLSPTPVQWTTAGVRFANPGDILLCVRGATTGKKNISDRAYCIGRGIAAVRGKSAAATTQFLWFALDYATGALLAETAGSTFPNLPVEKLENFSITLPHFEDQKRIATLLQEQFAAVQRAHAAAEAQLAAAISLPSAYLRSVFNSAEAQTWPKVRIGQIAEAVQNGIYKPAEYYGSGHPFVRMYNIPNNSCELDLTRLAQVVLEGRELDTFRLHSGDLLFSRVNSFELVGKCAIVGSDAAGYVFENMLLRVRLNNSAEPLFIAQQMQTRRLREQIQQVAKRAIGQASINADDLRGIEVMLPDINTQRCTVTLLAKATREAETLARLIQERLETIHALPAALLRRAFNGELA
jgi:type I restriction enzyme S subunit